MRRLVIALALCLSLSACLLTEDGKRITTESGARLLFELDLVPKLATEAGEALDGLLYQHDPYRMLTEADEVVTTEDINPLEL